MADENVLNRVLEHILDLKAGQGEIKKDISDLKEDVGDLKAEVSNLKPEVKQLRCEIDIHFNRVHEEIDTIYNIVSDNKKRIKVLEKTH